MKRAATRSLTAVTLGALLGLAACGSVTAKHSDGGGTGGTHADSSTKMDVAADRKTEDANESHDSASTMDMRVSDARIGDARMSDARTTDGAPTDGAGSEMGGGGGQCQANADCTLWPKYGKSCCGVCQPTGDPAPNKPTCLVACKTPLMTCTCINQQCAGGT